jgi:hypothetical protein
MTEKSVKDDDSHLHTKNDVKKIFSVCNNELIPGQ